MTFNKMRFPIVWITFALCVVLCGLVEVQGGPVRQDVGQEDVRAGRQIPYDEDEEEEDDSEEDDDDGEEQQLNYPAAGNQSEEEDDGRRSLLRRSVRDVSQKPVAEVEADEESVIPNGEAPAVPEKKPSVLELLSSALDKAIEATSKIPTQQVASDAAGVFQILGQVFSEAIDKVIGEDDGPEDNTEAAPESAAEEPAAPVPAAPVKVEEPQQEASQSDKEIVNNL